MRGVGEQRETVENEPADYFGDEIGGGQPQRPGEHLRVGARRMVVAMAGCAMIVRHQEVSQVSEMNGPTTRSRRGAQIELR